MNGRNQFDCSDSISPSEVENAQISLIPSDLNIFFLQHGEYVRNRK